MKIYERNLSNSVDTTILFNINFYMLCAGLFLTVFDAGDAQDEDLFMPVNRYKLRIVLSGCLPFVLECTYIDRK